MHKEGTGSHKKKIIDVDLAQNSFPRTKREQFNERQDDTKKYNFVFLINNNFFKTPQFKIYKAKD